jgi:hypothetical protein
MEIFLLIFFDTFLKRSLVLKKLTNTFKLTHGIKT